MILLRLIAVVLLSLPLFLPPLWRLRFWQLSLLPPPPLLVLMLVLVPLLRLLLLRLRLVLLLLLPMRMGVLSCVTSGHRRWVSKGVSPRRRRLLR